MLKRYWLWSVVALAELACSGDSLTAQQPDPASSLRRKIESSHHLDNLPGPPGDLEELLKPGMPGRRPEDIVRMLAERDPKLLDQAINAIGDPKTLQEILEGARNNEQLKDYLREKNIDPKKLKYKLNPQRLQEIRDSMQKAKEAREAHAASGADNSQNATRSGNPKDQAPAQNGGKSVQKALQMPPVGGNSRSDSGASKPVDSGLLKGIANLTERLQRFDAIRNSPAVNAAIRELVPRLGVRDERWEQLANGAATFRERFDSARKAAGLDRFMPEGGFSLPKGLNTSWFPKLSWPKGMAPRLPERSPIGALPDLGPAPSTDTWSGILAAVGILGLGFMLWRLSLRHSAARNARQKSEWRLGPWPVDPGAVYTRAELVRAFEYLSLLRFGRDALHWNHVAISSRLGFLPAVLSEEEPRRRAADELGMLYEQARYTPENDALPAEALAAAQHDLCLLARAPGA